jgi:hypothetical protein
METTFHHVLISYTYCIKEDAWIFKPSPPQAASIYRNSQWKLVMLQAPTGGRVTVFQSCLPNHGPGLLSAREDPSQRAGKEAPHLNPATDFYKRLALDCSGQQVAVDLFLINSQYSDLATLCKFHSSTRYF